MPGAGDQDIHPGQKASGQAISLKLLNSLSPAYIENPKMIFYRIRTYVDALVNYSNPRAGIGLAAAEIGMKVLRLGVRDSISPPQWLQLHRAIRYGKSRGVSVVITRISG